MYDCMVELIKVKMHAPNQKESPNQGIKEERSSRNKTTETEGGSRNEAPETDKKKEFFQNLLTCRLCLVSLS